MTFPLSGKENKNWKITTYFGREMRYLSNFGEWLQPMDTPLPKTLAGILNTFLSFPYLIPKHTTKSQVFEQSLPPTNDHQIYLGSVILRVFKSILFSFHIKSNGVLRLSEGRAAPYLSINQFSQIIPSVGLPLYTLLLGLMLSMYQRFLMHLVLQYRGLLCHLSERLTGISLVQNLHTITRYYRCNTQRGQYAFSG